MSISPNNPFDKDSPSNREDQPPEQPKKSNKGCLIAVIVLIALFVLICGCCGFGVYFTMAQLESTIQLEVASDPAITEHIGEIESVDFDLGGTMRVAQEAEQAGDTTPLVFEVTGSQGEGTLLVMTDGSESGFESATLVLPDGTRIPLDTMDAEKNPDGVDVDDLDMDDLFDDGELSIDIGAESSEAEPSEAEPEPSESEPSESESSVPDGQDNATDDVSENSPE